MPLWHVPALSETSPLAVADGVLVVHGRDADSLVGLRARDGAILWHGVLSWGPATSRGGVLYVNVTDGVYALRFADGRILWQTPVKNHPIGSPVAEGTAVYVAA